MNMSAEGWFAYRIRTPVMTSTTETTIRFHATILLGKTSTVYMT